MVERVHQLRCKASTLDTLVRCPGLLPPFKAQPPACLAVSAGSLLVFDPELGTAHLLFVQAAVSDLLPCSLMPCSQARSACGPLLGGWSLSLPSCQPLQRLGCRRQQRRSRSHCAFAGTGRWPRLPVALSSKAQPGSRPPVWKALALQQALALALVTRSRSTSLPQSLLSQRSSIR
jgi:hypothetical protein